VFSWFYVASTSWEVGSLASLIEVRMYFSRLISIKVESIGGLTDDCDAVEEARSHRRYSTYHRVRESWKVETLTHQQTYAVVVFTVRKEGNRLDREMMVYALVQFRLRR
jgi:hypothetical protein